MHPSNNLDDWDTNLYAPTEIVSNEEHDTIVALLEERVETLYQSRAIVDPRRLVEQLTKPIRPLWITNNKNCSENKGTGLGHDDSLSLSSLESSSAVLSNVADDYFWIICVNPSTYSSKGNRKQSIKWHGDQHDCPYATSDDKNGEKDDDGACHPDAGYYYLPGAGDDEESWARHLTPALFWSHIEDLIDPSLTEDDVDSRIDTLVTLAKSRTDNEEEGESSIDRSLDDPFSDQIGDLSLWIGSRRSGRPPGCWHHFDAILNVTNQEYEGMDEGNRVAVRVEQQRDENGNGDNTRRFYMQLPVAEGKRDKTELERWMPCGLLFLVIHLQQHRRVLVHCNQGKDRSVAIVLAFLVVACNLNFPPSIINELYDWDTSWAVERKEEDDGGRSSDYDDISGLSKSVIQRLSQDDGREEILKWIHAQRQDSTTLLLQPIADKERLRIALHLILQYRSQADPTRSTLQKLNRFFMSSPLYRKS
jgi:tRNA A64-2'-O-ribosylphosphate transferase